MGTAAVATNCAVRCHPTSTDAELDHLADVLGVPHTVAINYGGPLVGSGLLATDHGYDVRQRTAWPEHGRIDAAL